MKTAKVTSREYKVMLRPGRFAGAEKKLLGAAREFWTDFSGAVPGGVSKTTGALKQIDKRRLVSFLDTDAQDLRHSGYIVRVRRTVEGEQPEVTLKFRHPDRHVAESRRMKSVRTIARTKFEEDIKAPFTSLYSFSATAKIGKKGVPSNLVEASKLFPELSKRLRDIEGDQSLSEVNGFTARELLITGATIQIGSGTKTGAECALIVWYDNNGSAMEPVAVEFSYRYGDIEGQYGGGTARRAFEVFGVLQTELQTWVDPNPRTKTAFVFG
jgi:hypothetical protein